MASKLVVTDDEERSFWNPNSPKLAMELLFSGNGYQGNYDKEPGVDQPSRSERCKSSVAIGFLDDEPSE